MNACIHIYNNFLFNFSSEVQGLSLEVQTYQTSDSESQEITKFSSSNESIGIRYFIRTGVVIYWLSESINV